MSVVNESRFLVQNECVSANAELMKVYVTQSKNGIIMNVGVSVRS